MWGDWLLVDVQWAFFRYQQSDYGTSLIFSYKDIVYIFLGQTTGWYNIVATFFWIVGVVILLFGLCISIIASINRESCEIRTASYFTMSGGIFLGLSAVSRFFGGFAIPVGVPIILIIGWWMYRENFKSDDTGVGSNNEGILSPVVKSIATLIVISILVKILVFVITIFYFKNYVDTWALNVYYETLVIPLAQGQLPYINYEWEYPILMVIPVYISAFVSGILQNREAFNLMFYELMAICDAISLTCVYLIANKIYNNPKKAFVAGFLFATAFSAGYFMFTSFEAMPVCLVLVALTFTIYGDEWKGYLAIILGFFTKIFPLVLLPFIFLYFTKESTIKAQVIQLLKIAVPAIIILMVPILIANPSSIETFLAQTEMQKAVFASTLTYTIYQWLYGILGINIAITTVATCMTVILVCILVSLAYITYSKPVKNPFLLLKCSLIALVALIVCTKFHSPQYMLWITPIICILIAGGVQIADEISKIFVFYAFQVFEYIKFPLAFGIFWDNGRYMSPVSTPGGVVSLILFTADYLILFCLVLIITRKDRVGTPLAVELPD